jgi:superfamily II DNA or RNA helicase
MKKTINVRDEIQKEALDIAVNNSRCTLAVSVGVGKTLIGLKYIEHFQDKNMNKLNVLVVAPKLSIFESWKNDAEKFNISLNNVEFTTYLSLNKHNPNNYDLIVLDECHSLLYSHHIFLAVYANRILGLTGTPPRFQKSEKGEMVNTYCPVKYKYVTDSAVEDKILNDYHIYVHMLYMDNRKNIPMSVGGKSWFSSETAVYDYWSRRITEASTPKQKMMSNIMRMKMLMGFKSKEEYANKLLQNTTEKCILFANTIEQARSICEYTYDSKNPDSVANLEMFSNGKINQLGCVLQLSEGINIPNLKEGIIMHAYGNERKSSQRIGRLMRLNPKEKSTIHILCYVGTADERWVRDALADYDTEKVTYINQMSL